MDELASAIRKLPLVKATGPDLILNELVKFIATRHPDIFLETYNVGLTSGFFPGIWKKAKLVLLWKDLDKSPDQPSSYRLISLLDSANKVLERLLLNRLRSHIN